MCEESVSKKQEKLTSWLIKTVTEDGKEMNGNAICNFVTSARCDEQVFTFLLDRMILLWITNLAEV